ncbi:MAG TPA: carbohydrate kinase [Sphingobium sp.]|nr:carbohydrate kinase [Sphingobium sp.]
MAERAIIVLDVGKTMAKLSLWSHAGDLLARATRPNERVETGDYVALDTNGIEDWMASTLAHFATTADVGAIIPVSHGAAAAIVGRGQLLCPPIDYEEPINTALRRDYDKLRDAFALTGSPALPDGLNLGAQLYRLEALYPDLLRDDAIIMPWAQYWSWLLCGVAASEATSLGCHTDLWRPATAEPSALAVERGWAARFAPMARAGEILGTITPEWVKRTGLPADVHVHCGLHDSNAALLAARGFPEIARNEATVLSTGTWFVAMRTPAPDVAVDIASLPEARDCLVNVDAYGRPVPSARFMGGREIETLTGVDSRRVDIRPDQPTLLAAVPHILASQAMVLPTFAPGFGPFGHGRGRWIGMPDDNAQRRAAVCLYAALVASTSLDLIGTRERVLVEGRFAEAEVFVRGLASLRPDLAVYVSNAHNDVSYGALRLLDPKLAPSSALVKAPPLDWDLTSYRGRWLREAERMEDAA